MLAFDCVLVVEMLLLFDNVFAKEALTIVFVIGWFVLVDCMDCILCITGAPFAKVVFVPITGTVVVVVVVVIRGEDWVDNEVEFTFTNWYVVGSLSAGGGGGGGGLLVDVDCADEEIVALVIASERTFEDVSFGFVVVGGVGFTFIDDKIADRGLLDPSLNFKFS